MRKKDKATGDLFAVPPVVVDMKKPAVDKKAEVDKAREEGHERAGTAVDHAARVRAGWLEEARAAVFKYGTGRKVPWLCEDARAQAEKDGLAQPPEPRSWGGVVISMRCRKEIVKQGLSATESSSGGYKTLWLLRSEV